jgi:hypothetical protein
MWIVKLALSRPYTFVVLALVLILISPVILLRTPVDIFGRAACLAGCLCGGLSLLERRALFALCLRVAEEFQCRIRE